MTRFNSKNSDIASLKGDLLQLQSQLSEMNSTFSMIFGNVFGNVSNVTGLPSMFSLQVVKQNVTWLANSSQAVFFRLANPLQGVFDVEGYSRMTVLLRVESVSGVGPVEAPYQDVEIALGSVLWWTNMSEASQGLPPLGGGGFTEELNMESHFDDIVHVYNDYSQSPSGNRTYFLDWQIMPVSVSTIETKAPYVTLLLFANSTAPVNGWTIVDLYAYFRNG